DTDFRASWAPLHDQDRACLHDLLDTSEAVELTRLFPPGCSVRGQISGRACRIQVRTIDANSAKRVGGHRLGGARGGAWVFWLDSRHRFDAEAGRRAVAGGIWPVSWRSHLRRATWCSCRTCRERRMDLFAARVPTLERSRLARCPFWPAHGAG